MRTQPIERNASFGNLCGIRCNTRFENGTYGYFKNRALLINDLMDSKAFKELGKHLDFDAVFNFHTDVFNSKTYKNDAFSYELKLVSAKKPTPGNKFRNLPIEISVLECKAKWPEDAYNTFKRELNNINGDKLYNMVRNALKKELDWVKKTSRINEESKKEFMRAEEAIQNSEIPIDFKI